MVKAKAVAAPVVLHWFRKGLRLHDNPALVSACKGASQVYPVFVMDPHFAKPELVGLNRYAFLLETLVDLDSQLKTLGSRLFVVRGNPVEKLPELFKEWQVQRLTFENDVEPYAKLRDAEVCRLARSLGVEVVEEVGHTLHDPEAYVAKLGGKPTPTALTSFRKIFGSLGPVPQCAPTVDGTMLPKDTSGLAGDSKYDVPTLEEMGYPPLPKPLTFPGGEVEALRRLEEHIARTDWIAEFEKPHTSPNSLEPSTTVLSPYLKYGALSCRLFWHQLQAVYSTKKKHSQPPMSLHGQLLWREFWYHCGHTVPHFDQMEGNPICRQIPWDCNPEKVLAWKEARTGFPFIDAVMTQLREEGWIHHLARHSVACFLTRGDLWQSWVEGVKVFDLWLLDADWCNNNANWMWLSCSAYFHQYFRVYSPISFGKKTDANGDYIRKWIPKLAQYPARYIYEPWTAPKSVQAECGCIIGQDYPEPIVDHKLISKENIKRMADAFQANKEHNQDDDDHDRYNDPKTTPQGKRVQKRAMAKGGALGKDTTPKKQRKLV